MYKAIGTRLPWREKTGVLLDYAGYEGSDPAVFTAKFFYAGVALSVATAVPVYLFFGLLFSLAAAASVFVLVQALPYFMLVIIADRRAREVETILPDALQLMAANIRAGQTTERAIWLSARPEFGPLEDEIKRVSSKVLGGESIDDSLQEMTKRIDSSLLDRAVKLMMEGIRSGGEMATLLEETAADIRTAQEMRKKVKSNVTMYSMFIIFASVFGAPGLFAVSLYFMEVTSKLWGEQMSNVGQTLSQVGAGSVVSMQGPQVSPSQLQIFSISVIVLTTVCGGFIIGLIQEGKASRGTKYIPPMVAIALAVFFGGKFLIDMFFGGLIGF